MILLGLLAVWGGIGRIPQWAALATGAQAAYAIFLLAGAALAAAGVWLLLAPKRGSAWTGAAAAAALGATVLIGVTTGAIPCSGPG